MAIPEYHTLDVFKVYVSGFQKRGGPKIPTSSLDPRYSGPYSISERYPGLEYPLVDITPDIQDLLSLSRKRVPNK